MRSMGRELFEQPEGVWRFFNNLAGLMKKWRCMECGYVFIGEEPPGFCPECYAPAEAFTEVTDAA